MALVIGAGGGFGLGPLAASGATENANPVPQMTAAAPRVSIEDVTGVAKVLTQGGVWRRVRTGDSVERPTVIVTEGLESSVTVSQGSARVIARHDARVVLSAPGAALSVQLDEGLVLVHSRGNQVRVFAPSSQAVLTGEAFGTWVRGEQLVAAVLEGEVSIETPSISSKYGKGREIAMKPKGPVPIALSSQLEVIVDRAEKAGSRFKLSGKTTPNAQILARRGNKYEMITVGENGGFSVELDTKDPARGDLIAFDAAGRRAEINLPSETLDDVLNALAKGEPLGAHPAAAGGVVSQVEKAAPAKAAAQEAAAPAAKTEEPAAAPAKAEPAAAQPAVEAPVAAKKEPEKKPAKGDHPTPRGSEPSPIKIDMPTLPSETGAAGEKAQPPAAEKPAKKGAKKKGADQPAKEQPAEEKKEEGDKPVELQWE